MKKQLSKSRIVYEKESLQGIAMLLIGTGAGIFLLGAETDPINWMRMLAGAITLGFGFLLLYARGFLKFNRWEDTR